LKEVHLKVGELLFNPGVPTIFKKTIKLVDITYIAVLHRQTEVVKKPHVAIPTVTYNQDSPLSPEG